MGATEIDEDAVETQVMSRSAFLNAAKPEAPPESGLPSSKPPQSVIVERHIEAPPEPPEPRPSRLQRIARWLDRFVASFHEVFLGAYPPLSEELPKRPAFRPRQGTLISAHAVAEHEQGERMLLALLRAPPPYQKAAIAVARRARVMRDDGPDGYLDFVVHFVVSRIPPDKNGQIAVERLCDMLPYKVYSRDIWPALVRLEERGLVSLIVGEHGSDPMAEMLRENVKLIELRRPV